MNDLNEAGKSPRTQTDLKLWSAIHEGNNALTQDLLARHGSNFDEIFHPHGYKESPYVTALRNNQLKVIPILLEHGISVNKSGVPCGHIPLLLAAKRNLIELVNLFLKKGADPNCLDRSELGALVWAVEHNNTEMVEMLVTHGAKIDQKINGEKTSLHFAVDHGKIDMVKKLIQYNADVNSPDDMGNTPLFSSVGRNDHVMTSVLLGHGSIVNVINMDYRTPLHIAAASVHQSSEITNLLLDNGALVNCPDRFGAIPFVLYLENSLITRNFLTAESLIKHGSELNSERSIEALKWRAKAHHSYKLVKLAIKAGFKVLKEPWFMELSEKSPSPRTWRVAEETDEASFINYLEILKSYPRPLSETCRTVLREYLIQISKGASIYHKINELPLPTPLISYLQLEV